LNHLCIGGSNIPYRRAHGVRKKSQAKACVRKSDSRLVRGAYGGYAALLSQAASILPGIVGIFRAPGVCYNQ
jgi:hypothetical protein